MLRYLFLFFSPLTCTTHIHLCRDPWLMNKVMVLRSSILKSDFNNAYYWPCSLQLLQHCACSMKLSLGQIWALLLKHSNHFWGLLPRLQKVEANKLKFWTSFWFLHLLHSSIQLSPDFTKYLQIYLNIYFFIFVWDWMCRIGLARFMSLLNSMYLWHRNCCTESVDIYGAIMQQ